MEVKNIIRSKEELLTLKKCVEDPFFFSQFVYIIHPIRGKVKFDLYPFQKSVLWEFMNNRFNIVLKNRQMGISELIAFYCLWLALFKENQNVQIISIKDKVAKKLLRRIKYMYKNLPDYLQLRVVNGTGKKLGTANELEFENGSIISSIPTTEDAGRSEAVSLLVIDEAAILRWASTIWAAAFPTLSTGGSAIINSCVTGDTKIVGRNGDFEIDKVCPKDFGVQDVRFMNLEVLSHKLQWRKVLYGVNKGKLETWNITNNHGDNIRCTPAHKFLTPYGWKTASSILKRGLPVIRYQSFGISLTEPPKTEPPKEEIFKVVKGYPNYMISNLGKLIIGKTGLPKRYMIGKAGYKRVKLWNKKKAKNFTLSRLVAEHFIGDIPEGYCVDHINCNINDNHVNNLQIINYKENSKRATQYSRSLALNNNTGKGAADIELVGYIKYLDLKGFNPDEIISKVDKRFNRLINRPYVSRILSGKRNKGVTLSHVFLLGKSMENIYDITVEGDESYISTSNYISHNTPMGIGNWYHQMWVDACSGGNLDNEVFNPIRLYWTMHPERDQKWYNQMRQILGPRRTAQEVDGDFLTSGNSVFDLMDIKAIEDTLSEFIPVKLALNGNLRIYDLPRKGVKYFIAADIASGRARDYSAFTLMTKNGTEVGCFKGKITIERFAKLLYEIGRDFNDALLAPEANDIGQGVIKLLQEWNYPNLYYTIQFIKEKNRKKPKKAKIPGWVTSVKNRHAIIMELEADIRNDMLEIKDPFFVQEAYTFIYNENNKPVAMGKDEAKGDSDDLDDTVYTDDSIMAKSIVNFIRKGRTNSVIVSPK